MVENSAVPKALLKVGKKAAQKAGHLAGKMAAQKAHWSVVS